MDLKTFIFGKPRDKEGEKPPPPNCLVIDLKNDTYGLEYIKDPECFKTLWRYEGAGGRLVYWLIRSRDDVLREVVLPETLDCLPEKLYRALEAKEVEIIYAMPLSLAEKFGYGIVVTFGIVALFICYLMTQ